jgi:hypothetical protein
MEEQRKLTDKFMLRLPDGMRDKIKASAELNNRSMNAEIVQVLQNRYPDPPDVEDMITRAALLSKLLVEKVESRDLGTTADHARSLVARLGLILKKLEEEED